MLPPSHSFAAGRRAKALHDGAFVWADSEDADYSSRAANSFNIGATGGLYLDVGATAASAGAINSYLPIYVNGVQYKLALYIP